MISEFSQGQLNVGLIAIAIVIGLGLVVEIALTVRVWVRRSDMQRLKLVIQWRTPIDFRPSIIGGDHSIICSFRDVMNSNENRKVIDCYYYSYFVATGALAFELAVFFAIFLVYWLGQVEAYTLYSYLLMSWLAANHARSEIRKVLPK